MKINLLVGLIPFFASLAGIVLINIMKFNVQIKDAQKYLLVKSFVSLLVFYVAASYENAGVLDDYAISALNQFLMLLSAVMLYVYFAIVSIAFVICRKSNDFTSVTLSDVPEFIFNQYSNPISLFKKDNYDKRTYFQRLKIGIIPWTAFAFMYLIYGVYELYFANTNEWKFIFSDILLPSIIVFLLLILAICIAAYFIRGKNFNKMVMFFSAVCVMSYVQDTFFNTNELIDGTQRNASDEAAMLNLIIWLCITVLVPKAVSTFFKGSKKRIPKICSAITGLILIMQGASLSYILMTGLAEGQSREKSGYTLSGEDQYEVSSEENVIVFIMDTYYSGYFDNWIETHPEYYDILSDFIYFDDVSSEVQYTAFSLPSLLTAHDLDYTIGLKEAGAKCWESDEADLFYSSMHNAGYSVRLYTDNAIYAGGAESMLGKIDNVTKYTAVYTAKEFPTYFAMMKLSIYKYVPHSMKNIFYISDSYQINKYTQSDSIADTLDTSNWQESSASAKSRGIDFYNFDYYSSLSKGLTTTEDKLCIFQHIYGMHESYISIENDSSGVDEDIAQEGCLKIFTNYISQLKEIGVYDNSTIILTADHGIHGDNSKITPIMLIKPRGRTNNRLVINSAPGNVQTDLLPTILDSIGLQYKPLEYSLLDLDENMQRERILRVFEYSTEYPAVPKCEAAGSATYNSYEEYKFTGRCSDTDFSKIESTKYPITDYWW